MSTVNAESLHSFTSRALLIEIAADVVRMFIKEGVQAIGGLAKALQSQVSILVVVTASKSSSFNSFITILETLHLLQ